MENTEEQIREAAIRISEPFGSRLKACLEMAKWMQDQQPKWISVEDKLPENDDFVLCSINNGVLVYGCWYSEEINYWYGYGSPTRETRITHWMLFPEPPISSTT